MLLEQAADIDDFLNGIIEVSSDIETILTHSPVISPVISPLSPPRHQEGDDGEQQPGQANGYGTVAVDLAAEAEKAKETMKALRKAQMDKPPPVAMKKDPKTGEMVKFESEALKDDLPEEEAESGEIEIPVGDDY